MGPTSYYNKLGDDRKLNLGEIAKDVSFVKAHPPLEFS